jgi:hypothetical protein
MTDALSGAAFGADPGRWPLPAAATPYAIWLRAVAAGGQGRYASALADLARLRRMQSGPALLSLAHSTTASFLRQLGGHTRARGWDGRAVAVAGADVAARADALIGLAADALGIGRFLVATRLLQRAAGELADARSARLAVRLSWVRAELAMAQGRGENAVDDAERAVEAAAAFGSVRHSVKSEVVLSAALCSAGDVVRSRREADAALQRAERCGLVPLQWAVACLLADIGSDQVSPERVVAIRDRCADTVRRRGGAWSVR